jgi:serine/threonine protein kinase
VTLSSGTRLGSYEIVSLLGAGGMGEVYIAEDTKLERRVALKVLAPDVADDPERRSRFEREAKAVAALNHPNIVTIYSVEEPEGVHIITMELVRGKTLTELIPKKGLPLDEFFAIAIPVSDAVSAAHQEGITHRDLKPDNVMVSGEGRPKILDFGLAKLKQNIAPTERGSKFPTKTKTQVGRIMGTAAYMSPEQAEGKAIDHRSDVFSLGIVLYEMATGRHPFPGESTVSVLSAIIKDTPTSVTEVRPTLPRDLARILRRCLAKDPEHRYQTAKDLRNELKELNEEVTSGSRIGVEQVASARQPWHGRSGLWLGASVVVLGIGILAWAILDRVETPGLPTQAIPITSLEGMERDPRLSPDGEVGIRCGSPGLPPMITAPPGRPMGGRLLLFGKGSPAMRSSRFPLWEVPSDG